MLVCIPYGRLQHAHVASWCSNTYCGYILHMVVIAVRVCLTSLTTVAGCPMRTHSDTQRTLMACEQAAGRFLKEQPVQGLLSLIARNHEIQPIAQS